MDPGAAAGGLRIGIMLRAFEEKGGVGVYTRNVTRHLVELGVRHRFFLYYGSADSVGALADAPNVVERRVRAPGKAVWDQVAMPYRFVRDRLDVLFHPKFTVPLLCGSRSVMVLHGAGWFIPETRHYWTRTTRAYVRVMMPVYCRRAGKVLSVSEITRSVFCETLGVSPEKIRTVYFAPGTQFGPTPDAARIREVRERYGLPEGFILTLSGGDRAERKNFGTLLAAFQRIHGRRPVPLVVAGRDCESLRDRYGIPATGYGAQVLFPGWVDQADLPVLYHLAAVFLYPSNMEAFPIPITEALACGCPIVTSDVYGLRELAGDAALRVDPGDPDAIADAVTRILDDPGLAADLRARALERSRLFDWDRCARETLSILEEVAARRA